MMSKSEKAALRSEHIVEFYKIVGEYRVYIQLGDDVVAVHIRLSEGEDGMIYFATDHHFQSPDLASPYVTSRNSERTVDAALERAVDSLTCFIEGAVTAGHSPRGEWLVPSRSY